MKEELDQYIDNEPKLNGALIGMSIRTAKTGEKLYDRMGDTRLRPASNMKLLTAAAALSTLGKDYTFSTEISTDGLLKDNQLEGNLYITGKGDPTLLPRDFQKFAKQLRMRGIEKIAGDIIGDDTWFDDIRLSSDMIWSDEHYYYGAQVSALTVSPNEDYDAGSVIVEVFPGNAAEEVPVIKVSPETEYIKIVNQASTTLVDGAENLIIERVHGGNEIIIKGTIPAGADPIKEFIAVWEPTGYALDIFQTALKDYGITWTGTVKYGQTPTNTESLLIHDSIPLSELLIPFMKLSNNGHGEVLIKEMGKVTQGEGSWEKGIEVLKKILFHYELNIDTLVIRDGSGISHANLIPPHEITKLLFAIQKEPWFPIFLKALPVAGDADRMVGGTLQDRMPKTSVLAKTGTIYSVSTLSGYLTTSRNEALIFSIMINNLLDEEEGKEIEDNIADILS